MALLKSKPFLAANLYNMIFGAGVFAIFAFVPLYATSVHKLSTLMSGVILDSPIAGSHSRLSCNQLSAQAVGVSMAHGVGFDYHLSCNNPSGSRTSSYGE